jgi:hypothetical protein
MKITPSKMLRPGMNPRLPPRSSGPAGDVFDFVLYYFHFDPSRAAV